MIVVMKLDYALLHAMIVIKVSLLVTIVDNLSSMINNYNQL